MYKNKEIVSSFIKDILHKALKEVNCGFSFSSSADIPLRNKFYNQDPDSKDAQIYDYSTPLPRIIASHFLEKVDKKGISSIGNFSWTSFDSQEIACHLISKIKIPAKWKVSHNKGFINFMVPFSSFFPLLNKIVKEGNLPVYFLGKKKIDSYIIEFVSANPTGRLHIGHARNAFVGDVISKLLKFFNYKVKNHYYVNDVGSQMNKFCSSLQRMSVEGGKKKSNKEKDEYNRVDLEEVGNYIQKVQKIKKSAIVSLGKKQLFAFITSAMLSRIKKELDWLGVKFDTWVFESELNIEGEVKNLIERLYKKDLIYKKDENYWLKTHLFFDTEDRVIMSRKEKRTYFLSDLIYHCTKFENNSNLINIWGSDHHGYIPRLRSGLKMLGYDEKKVHFVLLQMVQLKNEQKKIKKMSKRTGNCIFVSDVQRIINADLFRYLLLSFPNSNHISLNLAEISSKEEIGNPFFYLRYVYLRCNGILKKAGVDLSELESYHYVDTLKSNWVEKEMCKRINNYPQILWLSLFKKEPYLLLDYLKDFAKIFHFYYQNYSIISKNKKEELLSSSEKDPNFINQLVLIRAIQILFFSFFKILNFKCE